MEVVVSSGNGNSLGDLERQLEPIEEIDGAEPDHLVILEAHGRREDLFA
jgi:hypothetical protein